MKLHSTDYRHETSAGSTGVSDKKIITPSENRQPTLRRSQASHLMKLQSFLALFACVSLGLLCFATLVLFYLQGFHAWGFRLEPTLMHWLGIATIGAVASLASVVYRAVFGK